MLQTMQARSERCCEGGTKLDIVMQVTIGGRDGRAPEVKREMSLSRMNDDSE